MSIFRVKASTRLSTSVSINVVHAAWAILCVTCPCVMVVIWPWGKGNGILAEICMTVRKICSIVMSCCFRFASARCIVISIWFNYWYHAIIHGCIITNGRMVWLLKTQYNYSERYGEDDHFMICFRLVLKDPTNSLQNQFHAIYTEHNRYKRWLLDHIQCM